MALKTTLGQTMLLAYREALQTRKANDFAVVGLASLIIRLEGRDGRIAVQATKKEISPSQGALVTSGDRAGQDPKKSVRLRFPKQEQGTEEAATETATKFGLKRVGATQDNDPNKSLPDNHGQSQQGQSGNNGDAAVDTEELIAERDYWKATAQAMAQAAQEKAEADGTEEVSTEPDVPSEEDKGLFKDLMEAKEPEPKKETKAPSNPNLPELKNPPPPPKQQPEKEAKPQATKSEDPALSKEEQDLVKTMKPGGVGREFGLGRLRATLTDLGIEWNEEHSPTVLAGALLKHLNPK